MGLRIEEYLGVAHVLSCGFLQVGSGQVVEILLVKEYPGGFVVDVQEGLQVAEVVGPAHLFHGGVPQSDPVAFGDLEHQLGFKGTLDVDV